MMHNKEFRVATDSRSSSSQILRPRKKKTIPSLSQDDCNSDSNIDEDNVEDNEEEESVASRNVVATAKGKKRRHAEVLLESSAIEALQDIFEEEAIDTLIDPGDISNNTSSMVLINTTTNHFNKYLVNINFR